MSAGVSTRNQSQVVGRQAGQKSLGFMLRQALLYGALIIGAFLSLFPFYYMFMASTLRKDQVLAQPPRLYPSDQLFDNLSRLLNDSTLELTEGIVNSVVIAIIFTIL